MQAEPNNPGVAAISDGLRRVRVIINPHSGGSETPVDRIDARLDALGIAHDVVLTETGDDITRAATEAAREDYDAVAIYGGDGSVVTAAAALRGTQTALAVLPGGTANVVAVELGVPLIIEAAVDLLARGAHVVKPIDVGRCGDHCFLVRVGIGWEAMITTEAPKEAKTRLGRLAYVLSGIRTAQQAPNVTYTITMADGKRVVMHGMSLSVCNSGNVGLPGVDLAPQIDISDGLIDVIAIPGRGVQSMWSLIRSAIVTTLRRGNPPPREALPHVRGTTMTIAVDPPQRVTYDGEVYEGPFPIPIDIEPGALRVIVPRRTEG